MKFGVVVFPGSNGDADVYHVIRDVFDQPASYIWHQEQVLDRYDCIVLPGGSSYGDYLRSGAIACFSPVMKSVIKYALAGGLLLGIGNGFQILLEAGLLPGAMLSNVNQQFICKDVFLRVDNSGTPFTAGCFPGEVLKIPIAHKNGNYFADPNMLRRLESKRQIVFRYCDGWGEVNDGANSGGSTANIAGICNERGNVLGMMPHPERCTESLLGGEDGKKIFLSVLNWWEKRGGSLEC